MFDSEEEEENDQNNLPDKKVNDNSFFDEGASNIMVEKGSSATNAHKLNYQTSHSF